MDLHSSALRQQSLENVVLQIKFIMWANVVDINVFAQILFV